MYSKLCNELSNLDSVDLIQFHIFCSITKTQTYVYIIMKEVIIVATPLWVKCEDETHTPKSGNLESFGTPENSELDCRG